MSDRGSILSDSPVKAKEVGINPFDLRSLPQKDIPDFLNKLPEDDNSSLRKPVPFGEIDFKTAECLIGERATRSLKHQLETINFKSLRHQCYCIDQVVQADTLLFLSKRSCARMLFLSRQQFHSFLDNYCRYLNNGGPRQVGRPPLIGETQSKELINEIRARQLELQPMTITNLCNHIFEKFKIPCSRRFVRDWISRNKNHVMIQYVKPADASRAAVRSEDLHHFYTQLTEVLNDAVPELVYNCDETGFSRRVTATRLRAVLCTDTQPEKAVYIQKPDESTVTLIACVNLAGKSLRPYVIVPTKSLDKEILKFVRPKKECVFSCQPSGFSTHAIFFDWFREVFLAKIRRQREKMKSPTKQAILIFDGFRGHDSDQLRAFAAENHVLLVKIPPHSSHLTQPLDQQVFQTLKAAYRRITATEFIKDRMARKLFKLTKAFGESFLPHIIRESWNSVGITCEWNDNGEFTKILVEAETVIQKEIPMSRPEEQNSKRKRMRIISPTGPINLEEISLVAEDCCPLCRSPKRPDSQLFIQSALVSKDSDVQAIQDEILERREDKLLRKGNYCLGDVDPMTVLEHLLAKGRLSLTARRHFDSIRERLAHWRVLEIVTAQTVKCQAETNELDMTQWTTSSKILREAAQRMEHFRYLPDMDERIFRILTTLVTEGLLEKREPQVEPREPEEPELRECEFRLLTQDPTPEPQ